MSGYDSDDETTVGPADNYEKLIVPADEHPSTETSPDSAAHSAAHRPTAQIDEPDNHDKVDESLYIDMLGHRIV